MSNRNCDACSNLLTDNAEFATNGTTATVQESLKENTGFNPNLTVLHTDCEDLNDANDCLIGNMIDEVDAYDVCDLRTYIKKFTSNLYELLKAIIAAICGLWEKVEELIENTSDNCESIDTLVDSLVGNSTYVSADSVSSKLSYSNSGAIYCPQFLYQKYEYKGCSKTTHTISFSFYIEPVSLTITSDLAAGDVLGSWNAATIKNAIGQDAYNIIKGQPGYVAFGLFINDTIVNCALVVDRNNNDVWKLIVIGFCGSTRKGSTIYSLHPSHITYRY